MIRTQLATLALLMMSAIGLNASPCEQRFQKTGNPFTGTDFSSRVDVPDLSAADAMRQMRGILIDEKMDVLTEDAESGVMLAEQRSQGTTRAIPTLINVSADGTDATVEMVVKTEKGMLAKSDAMRTYLCELLGKLKGGQEGRVAAARGGAMQNRDDVTVKDVFVFSREIANEAKGNALVVSVRHKGRKYALKGRVEYIQEDGDSYNVSFEIPQQHELALRLSLGREEPRVGVACLFDQQQLANVLTFRKGERANFTGAFDRYDDIKRMVWLKNCRQTRS